MAMSDEPRLQGDESEQEVLAPRGLGGFFGHTLPLVIYAAVIFYMGGGSAPPLVAPPIVGVDKVLHFGAFGIFALLSYRAGVYQWPNREKADQRRLAVIVASVVGGLLELYQLGFPNRSCDIWDFVADTLGAMVAGGILWAWSRYAAPARPAE
jgi:hypothetical protein